MDDDVEDEAAAFGKAMDRYKRESDRPYPTWHEVLDVLRSMGYRKCAEPSAFPRYRKGFKGHGVPFKER